MNEKAKKPRLKGCEGGLPRPISLAVLPHVWLSVVSLPLKQRFSLSYTCLHLFYIVAYYNGSGSTITGYMMLLYGYSSKVLYVQVQHRLDTLLSKGLVERTGGKYRLSALGVQALSSVTVEGEGAKLLQDIERRQKLAESRKAKKLAKIQDAKNV